MIADAILGATYGVGAALQPGPLQTYLAAEALAQGWRRTLPVALAPLLSDGPIIVFVMLALARLPAHFMDLLRCAGGVFLLYLAARTVRTGRQAAPGRSAEVAFARRSLLEASLLNLLNPNPYLAWTLVLGPLLLAAWRVSPWDGFALVSAFYATMVIVLAGLVVVFARAGSLGPRVNLTLLRASVVALAGLGIYQLATGAIGLASTVPRSTG